MSRTKLEELEFWNGLMREYISNITDPKYNVVDDMDILDVMEDPRICIWSIIKYAWRIWKYKGKTNDLFKISHYAMRAYYLCNGDLSKVGITNSKGD